MDESQALQLFRNKLGNDIDEAAALDLVRALDRIPLAVNQAAAYIYKRRPRVTVRSYLDKFRTSEREKHTLLRSDRGDLRRYEGVSNSVMVTWQVTFEQIRQERPLAAKLLSLMSRFHAQNIPEYILHGYSGNSSDDREREFDENFEEDLDTLRGYSLVTVTALSGLLEMHSLVQFCTKFCDPDLRAELDEGMHFQ